MKHLEVLVVSKNTTTPSVLNWKVRTVNTVETAIETLQQHPYRVVAIDTTILQEDKLKLNTLASLLLEAVVVVEFNDAATLAETVKSAYWSKNKPGSEGRYLDNAFEMEVASRITLN